MKTKSIYLFIVLFFLTNIVWAQLSFTSLTAPNGSSVNFDPDLETSIGLTATITTGSNGTGTTIFYYYLTIDPSINNRTAPIGGGVQIKVYETADSTKNNIAGSSGDTISSSTVPEGNQKKNLPTTQIMTLTPFRTSLIAPGTYSFTLNAILWEGIPGSGGTNRGTKSVNLLLVVPTIASMAIMPAGSTTPNYASVSQSVQFSELTPNTVKNFVIIVRANKNWNLQVSSSGAGKLVNTIHSTATVPYSLEVDSTPVAFPSTANTLVTVFGTNRSWSPTFSTLTSKVTLGAFDLWEAGDYSDSLTFTLSTY